MKAIEVETTITTDGRLPLSLQEAFGKRVRLIVLFPEKEPIPELERGKGNLMRYAGIIEAFKDIEDPVAFQRELRKEW